MPVWPAPPRSRPLPVSRRPALRCEEKVTWPGGAASTRSGVPGITPLDQLRCVRAHRCALSAAAGLAAPRAHSGRTAASRRFPCRSTRKRPCSHCVRGRRRASDVLDADVVQVDAALRPPLAVPRPGSCTGRSGQQLDERWRRRPRPTSTCGISASAAGERPLVEVGQRRRRRRTARRSRPRPRPSRPRPCTSVVSSRASRR